MGADTEQFDLGWVEEQVAKRGRGPETLIAHLQAIQEHYRYLPSPALLHLCHVSDITPAAVAGVSTFYSQFRHQTAGKHTVKVCVGTACHVKGAQQVYDSLHRHLGCTGDEDTDAAGTFTLQKVACLGCCTLAPVVQIDSVTYGHVTASSAPGILQDFLSRGPGPGTGSLGVGDDREPVGELRVGLGSCCMAGGSAEVGAAALRAASDLDVPVTVKRVGCVGMCHRTPLLEVVVPGRPSAFYTKVEPRDVSRIVHSHFRPRSLSRRVASWVNARVEELLTGQSQSDVHRRYNLDMRDKPVEDFLGRQTHIATEHCGTLDPTDLAEYRLGGGFSSLERCLHKMSPVEIINEVSASGLRGRGGAGFPTGTKWQRVREHADGTATVICNGDEGDPGAFMDRMLLESYPFRVIEGMAIAGRAVGARRGAFYIRAEYPLALERVREALRICREEGLLGEGILGSDFAFDIDIMEGAGAFVCGEETALIKSIEGKRGMPRFRPPFPAEKGLWGKPTLVNNCETLACVSWIMRNGAASFATVGTERSAGTKVFSLAGKIRHGGLIEVPMGMTIRQIVEEVGGGVAEGRTFKAVQIGGPSGGCIPADRADIPVDFDALREAGAMMGSGGLVVLDDTDCMVDIARYFLGFTQSQSCGRCTFCRVGTRRMLDLLEKFCGGTARSADLDTLEELAGQVASGSLCGLGKTAPNPVLTTLRYFRDEYEAHLEGVCPAGRCQPLISYSIDSSVCIGCTMCAQNCPVDAIPYTPHEAHEIDEEKCIRCDTCRGICPVDAVRTVPRHREADR